MAGCILDNQLNFNQNIIKAFIFKFWKSTSLYQQMWVARKGVCEARGARHWSGLRTRNSAKIASVIFNTPKPHSTYQSVLRDYRITHHVSSTHGYAVLKHLGLISNIFGDVWLNTGHWWWNVTDRENLRSKCVQGPLCTPQIPHGLTSVWPRALGWEEVG